MSILTQWCMLFFSVQVWSIRSAVLHIQILPVWAQAFLDWIRVIISENTDCTVLQFVGSLSASSRNLSWQCPLLAMPISHEIHTNTYCHTKLYTNRCNFLYTPILLIHHNICQYVKILIHTVTYQYRQVHFIYSPQNAWDLVHHVFDAGKSLFDLQLVSCHWSIICLGPVSPAKRKPA